MKIEINKQANIDRFNKVINEILTKAQETASKGLKDFTYYFNVGERSSFPYCINIAIREKSEGTVFCGYGCDYGSNITFCIKD